MIFFILGNIVASCKYTKLVIVGDSGVFTMNFICSKILAGANGHRMQRRVEARVDLFSLLLLTCMQLRVHVKPASLSDKI